MSVWYILNIRIAFALRFGRKMWNFEPLEINAYAELKIIATKCMTN